MISFVRRLLDIFEKCVENENYQFFKFTVSTIFFSSKAWNLPKTLINLFFVLYDITNIQNSGNDNNYLKLPINKNIMRYSFWRVYFKSKRTLKTRQKYRCVFQKRNTLMLSKWPKIAWLSLYFLLNRLSSHSIVFKVVFVI